MPAAIMGRRLPAGIWDAAYVYRWKAKGGANGTAEIMADVFYNSVGVTEIRFCIYIIPFLYFGKCALLILKKEPIHLSNSFRSVV